MFVVRLIFIIALLHRSRDLHMAVNASTTSASSPPSSSAESTTESTTAVSFSNSGSSTSTSGSASASSSIAYTSSSSSGSEVSTSMPTSSASSPLSSGSSMTTNVSGFTSSPGSGLGYASSLSTNATASIVFWRSTTASQQLSTASSLVTCYDYECTGTTLQETCLTDAINSLDNNSSLSKCTGAYCKISFSQKNFIATITSECVSTMCEPHNIQETRDTPKEQSACCSTALCNDESTLQKSGSVTPFLFLAYIAVTALVSAMFMFT